MAGFLSRFVDLRAEEGPLVLKSTVALAGLVAAHTMLETARDALFLGRLAPSRLTFVYGIMAAIALVASRANGAFVHRFGRRNALIFTVAGAAYGTIVIYLLPSTDPTVVFGLYLWTGLLGSVVVVQFWMLAGELFTVAEGKRLFGLLAAGGVLGAVIGASLSAVALRYVEVRHLLPAGAVLYLATALLATTIEVDEMPRLLAHKPRTRERPSFVSQLFSGAEVFRQNPYLVHLALLVAISTATVLATDYMFKSFAARSMTPDELGPFFAGYYAVLNGVALVTQVVVASVLVRRAGVLAAFCVLPGLLLTGGVTLLIVGGSLTAVLLIKGADGALRHSLHRISSELLWMPVPDDAKDRSKTLVDTVIVRGTQAAVAGGLFALASVGHDRPVILGAVIATFAAVWLAAAYRLRRPYLDLFRKALHRDAPDAMHGILNLNIESIAVVVEALSSRDTDRAIAAIDLLEANKQQQVIPALVLYHESPEVLIRALDVIAVPTRKDWEPLAERLLEHEEPAVRGAAVKALARNGDMSPLERRLLDIDPSVRAQAAFWLARSEDGPPENHDAIRQILDMRLTVASRTAHTSLLNAIATAGDRRWTPVVLRLCALDETDAEVLTALAAAMRKIRDARFIPVLIERLRYRVGRDAVRQAIVELGEPALTELERALKNPATSRGVRRHIPRTISRFTDQRAADILVDRLDVERSGLVRFKILRGLGRMVDESAIAIDQRKIEGHLHSTLVEYLRILSLTVPVRQGMKSAADHAAKSGGLLLGLLEDKLTQAFDRSFRYLHLIHRNEDLRGVAVAVRSKDRNLRAQALEYLDALTLNSAVSEIRTLLRLIADDLPDTERIARGVAFLPDPPRGYHEALSRLIRDPDDAVASIAAYHALMLKQAGLTSDVLSVSEERPTLSDLQRIVEHLSKSEEVPSVA